MRNVRISRLLPALFLLMVVLGGLQGVVAFRSLSAMTGSIERIGSERMPQLSGILQLSHAFSDLNATYSEHLLSMDPDEIGRIEARIKERADAFAGMVDSYAAANAGDADAAAEIDGIKAALKTYLDESAKLIQFSAIAAKGPALEVYKGPMQASADASGNAGAIRDRVGRRGTEVCRHQDVVDRRFHAASGRPEAKAVPEKKSPALVRVADLVTRPEPVRVNVPAPAKNSPLWTGGVSQSRSRVARRPVRRSI